MTNLNKQYTSFLGGEVSRRLWYRADMDKFGKWFSVAENIRFKETGSFYNRGGFQHIAKTKNNNPNDSVKLLSFSFNDEQSYLVELGETDGVGYARFFKNGSPIMSGDSPYEIQSPFSDLSGQTLKYAQSGDILFITNSKYGIWELRRLEADGSKWEFKKFDSNIMPMGDLEGGEGKYIKADAAELATAGTFFVQFPDDLDVENIENPELLINGESFWTDTKAYDIVSLGSKLTEVLTDKSITVKGDAGQRTLTFSCSDFSAQNVNSISIKYGVQAELQTKSFAITNERPYELDVSDIEAISAIKILAGSNVTTKGYTIAGWYSSPDRKWQYSGVSETFTLAYNIERTVDVNYSESNIFNKEKASSVLDSALKTINELPFQYVSPNNYVRRGVFKYHAGNLGESSFSNNKISIKIHPNAKWFGEDTIIPNGIDSSSAGSNKNTELAYGNVLFEFSYYQTIRKTIEAQKSTETQNGYLFKCYPDSCKLFKDTKPGDTFAVKNHMQAETIEGTFKDKGTSESVRGTGDYRYYTSGNWVGKVTVEFSVDNGATWKTLHTISSSNENAPGNDNTSGSLEADDIILFRASYDITSGSVAFVFETAAYDVWSYYKIKTLVSDTEAYAYPIRNDIGEISREEEFKKNAFSDSLGYPDCLGFYQNRLFFGKTYIIYASAVNDFWNFYQRAENLQDDDAMNMSLLSYKVNNIKNIVTDKAFFAFTGGGEFGIGAEGAITQADKFLKQFSSHGSSNVDNVLTGDLVLFVDKTENTVRALQYSLETDNYEASDVSILIREKLESKKIIKTDYSYKDKEAYFLTDDGYIFVMKYMPEQNILAWSHWYRRNATIKDICVVPNGPDQDLYITVSYGNNMCVEKLNDSIYLDSFSCLYNTEPVKNIQTIFPKDYTVAVLADGNRWYELRTDENGMVELPIGLTSVVYGLPYRAEGILLTPTHQQQDQTFSTYFLQRPFKVRFICHESYGFKVGEESEEKFILEWQSPQASIDDEQALTSGFKSVSISSRFGYDKKISFVQELPYPMDVQNVFIESDFGGK